MAFSLQAARALLEAVRREADGLGKPLAAAVMQRSTASLKGLAESQPAFFAQLSSLAHLPILAVGGGCLVFEAGQPVAALGVSGGSAEEDQAVCEAAIRSSGYSAE